MDFNATIDLIIKDLNEAREIIDDLKKYPGVPVLQVELAKAKCKSAGDIIALLKSLEDIIPTVKDEAIPRPLEPVMFEEEHPEPVSVKPVTKHEERKKEIVQEAETAIVAENKPEPEKITIKATSISIVADKFGNPSRSFNDQLADLNNDADFAEFLKTRPITNLTDAIGLGEKFLFISQIFDGNKDAYSQAIKRLDSVENLDDARAVIMSFKGDNDENDAVSQLLALVKRKLPANE
jgi:hypothetical protein